MNKIFKFFSVLSIVAIIMSACTADEYSLGAKGVKSEDLVEGIAYKIEHDATNPNIVYLTSLMGNGYTPLWNHPQGRSQEPKVTLKIPFAGTYNVQFGVETQGGVVYGDTTTFKVNKLYPDFISDELWTLLAGGSGKSKTWYLDLNATSTSKYFGGPLYFYGTNDSWESVTNGVAVGGDSWNWCPKYSENTWLMSAADFGSMTFDLIDGAHISVEHKTIAARGTEKGTYMMDVDNHTMKLTDAAILHDSGRDAIVTKWGDIKILSLTKDVMQLAVLRDNSSEGKCLLVYNFISKDYSDAWTPAATTEPEPKLPNGWQNDISQTVNKSIKWVLSTSTPFNWAKLDGSIMNSSWTAADKYPSWTGYTATAASNFANFSLTLNSANNTATYVAPNGTSTTGTYTLDDKGVYSFNGFKPNFVMCGESTILTTTDANQWRITSIEKDAAGTVTGMWVGKRDAVKSEYMVYHLVPQAAASGGSSEPQGTDLTFDNSKLVLGDLENKGNLRLELYNAYGSTASNPPLNKDNVKFGKKLAVKFTLEGITLKSGAVGSYTGALGFADGTWAVQYWGGESGDVSVTGNGTYTTWFTPTATANGATVFVIDIKGIASDISDMSAVKATVNSVTMY